MTAPAPTWPIESTVLYVVTWYETNALAQNPSTFNTTLMTYNEALAQAKDLITDNGNTGVCIIQPITCAVVYPSVAWVDF